MGTVYGKNALVTILDEQLPLIPPDEYSWRTYKDNAVSRCIKYNKYTLRTSQIWMKYDSAFEVKNILQTGNKGLIAIYWMQIHHVHCANGTLLLWQPWNKRIIFYPLSSQFLIWGMEINTATLFFWHIKKCPRYNVCRALHSISHIPVNLAPCLPALCT